jgi:hypothetical protein
VGGAGGNHNAVGVRGNKVSNGGDEALRVQGYLIKLVDYVSHVRGKGYLLGDARVGAGEGQDHRSVSLVSIEVDLVVGGKVNLENRENRGQARMALS